MEQNLQLQCLYITKYISLHVLKFRHNSVYNPPFVLFARKYSSVSKYFSIFIHYDRYKSKFLTMTT